MGRQGQLGGDDSLGAGVLVGERAVEVSLAALGRLNHAVLDGHVDGERRVENGRRLELLQAFE